MAKLVFYRQKRYDGGIRTGIELDNRPIAEHFDEEGMESERDPALLWFVDVRCEGAGIPDDPDAAEDWLIDRSGTIREGLRRFADRLRVGADTDIYCLTWNEFDGLPADVHMMIACSAIRRIDARMMSSILNEIADKWDEIIQEIDLPQEVEDLR